ncbi:bifunctional 3-deoxy-7-phosphoheptulonate synthase/chorismate mutase [Listeria fleischmannii]|jgi:3-deoxy-7-phosphoheptulonate synthase/chorismate mutase|uniref:Bifunctional 3-deoxy-7-phosphoheptulonate synthase/chorismate mutase n=1 Tax=Listeria fleischmannii TaxID=1069827 RepID=A0A841YBC6_9LIST|nr:bifunctional 3-deoxy-7-phosphoheptulonate synthase/chorismate mutase [Listeria fleischmannii]EIA19401.1 bifunctional 3-deoxy-7-phosphoheptulonate synthase/chorismate mutase [Listeria fleischmannii subsp. coloradonensis]MBC1397499.1 bifunctional 3-deoxy-7-phosphoheptulonate synthase/chorismate mutase [Listeria fleischmannii]MBC1418363.1 bifunctional 3-deoxy-7-phosphoheptulonate synthase/chorismate mutase [Listeria fleischmannii]MBC1425868.1 bifunctional 3-deoxy-7-phosphoheptulonate synthase/c
MVNKDLDALRHQVDELNLELLNVISKRANLVQEIGKIKGVQGSLRFDPLREREMLNQIVSHNNGPFEDSTIERLFKEIFKAGLELQEEDHSKALLVSRKNKKEDTIVNVNGLPIGNGEPVFVFGPCSVESYDQVAAVAASIRDKGLKLIRGGAFKPRTSPYDFQGLGLEGLQILKRISDEYGLGVISEIVTPADIETALDYVDVIQIGARNMQNFELLKEAGRVNKPILLKRGLSATIEEFIGAAEYIMSQGNGQIILCERGIRTYEKATRNTLDISAVPILKKETHLPVMVDVTHSTGRKDLLLPCAKAALAIEADGVMAEVHPDPAVALSDSAQQMNIPEFDKFWEEILSSKLMAHRVK